MVKDLDDFDKIRLNLSVNIVYSFFKIKLKFKLL